MNKAFLGLMVLAASQSAFATSTIRKMVDCSLAQPTPSLQTSVTVQSYAGPLTIGKPASISATVTNAVSANAPVTLNFGPLSFSSSPIGIEGGSTVYEGKDFTLVLYTDSAPLDDNKIAAQLAYEVDGAKVVDQMACEIYFYGNKNAL